MRGGGRTMCLICRGLPLTTDPGSIGRSALHCSWLMAVRDSIQSLGRNWSLD